MLYDPKWETKTKPDVFSLESLIAWLETMPAAGRYQYGECNECMLAQYFSAMGYKNPRIDDKTMFHERNMYSLPKYFNSIALDAAAEFRRPGDYRWTFGAALSRALSTGKASE